MPNTTNWRAIREQRPADKALAACEKAALMPEYSFTLVITGDVDAHLEELFEAGCGDALFGEIDGIKYAEFDRRAPDPMTAIASALAQINSVDGVRGRR